MNSNVKSAQRVLDILELIATSDGALSLRDVTATLAIPKSSAHMLLATLQARGYLLRSPEARFSLATDLKDGAGWLGGHARRLKAFAAPVLDRLVGDLEETTVLGVPTPGLDVRILSYRTSPLAIRYDVSTTPVLPGYCTAMGQAILANTAEDEVEAYLARTRLNQLTPSTLTTPEAVLKRLRQVRARGYALNIDERFVGASGAAFPIFAGEGRVVGALNMVTVTPRFLKKREAIIAALKGAATEIAQRAFGAGLRRANVDGA